MFKLLEVAEQAARIDLLETMRIGNDGGEQYADGRGEKARLRATLDNENDLAAYRAGILDWAMEVVKAERLVDETEHPEDRAYNQAIDDAWNALAALRAHLT